MRRWIIRAASAALIILAPLAVFASQGSLQMPTVGVFTGLTAAGYINTALQALYSCNSGTASPTNALGGTPVAGQCWLDTATTLLTKTIYDGASWVSEELVDTTNHVVWPPTGPTQTTGGTSTAYTLTTNYAPTALINGQVLSFIAGSTNGANVTLNVNGLGAQPIDAPAGTAVGSGSLVGGSVYTVTYNSATPAWVLSDVYAQSAVNGYRAVRRRVHLLGLLGTVRLFHRERSGRQPHDLFHARRNHHRADRRQPHQR